MSDDESTREERKDAYERVLSIVEHNTGDNQPALASTTSISQIAVGIGIEKPGKPLRAAVENGDLLRIRDRVVRTEEADLRDALGELNQQCQTVADALEEVTDDA